MADRSDHPEASLAWSRREFLTSIPPIAAASRTLRTLALNEPLRVGFTGSDERTPAHVAWFETRERCRVVDDPRLAEAMVIGSRGTGREVIEACEAGKHVYCEARLTMPEWMLASRHAKSRGTVLQTSDADAFARLHHAAAMLREGRFGRALRTYADVSHDTWSANLSLAFRVLERSLRGSSCPANGPCGLTVLTERGMLFVDHERLCGDPSRLLTPIPEVTDARAEWLDCIRTRTRPRTHFAAFLA